MKALFALAALILAPQKAKPYVYEFSSPFGGFVATLPAVPKGESVDVKAFTSVTNPFGRTIDHVTFDPGVRGGESVVLFYKEEGFTPVRFSFESFDVTTGNKTGNRVSKPGLKATLKVGRG